MSDDYEVETTVFRYKAGETHKFVGGSFRITDRYEDWEGTPQYIIEANLFNGTSVYPLIWSTTKVLNAIENKYRFSELFEGYTRLVGLDELGYGAKILFNGKVETVIGVYEPGDGSEILLYTRFEFEDEEHETFHKFPPTVRLEKI